MDLLAQILQRRSRTIGIDGNSGAGKTTLGKSLAQRLNATLIPYDWFHKKERKDWNMQTDINDFGDPARLMDVVTRLQRGERFTLHKLYDHTHGTFSRSVDFVPNDVIVVEGLCVTRLPLEFKIFLKVDPTVALARGKIRDLRDRNLTEEQWAVKMRLFHQEYSKLTAEFEATADLVIDTTESFPQIA